MSDGMVTLVAQYTEPNGNTLSATMTTSETAYDRDPASLERLVRAWFGEDYPGVRSDAVEVVMHRG